MCVLSEVEKEAESSMVVQLGRYDRHTLEPPVLMKREEPLTFSGRKNWILRKKTRDQSQSLLFRLPTEIRILVYQEYLGREMITGMFEGGRPRGFRYCQVEGELVNIKILGLLRTCRRV